MFRSFGIDNIFLMLRLPRREVEQLIDRCGSWDGTDTYLLLGSKKNPTITIRQVDYALIVNLNVPKLAWEHNIRLAGPKEVRQAFAKFSRITGFSLEEAQVLQVDLYLCEESVETLDGSLSLLKCPKGFKPVPKDNGCYFNGPKGRVTLLAYCKSAQIEMQGKTIPSKVLAQCESDSSTLLRHELRIGNAATKHLVGTELRRLKLWTSPYFIGSALHSNSGFNALASYYQRFMLEKVVLDSRRSRFERNAPKTLHAIKAGVAIERVDESEPERYLELAETLHEAGWIGSKLLEATRKETHALIYHNRIRRLASSIREVCSEVFEAYPVTISRARTPIFGRIPAADLHTDFENVARQSGSAQGVSRDAY